MSNSICFFCCRTYENEQLSPKPYRRNNVSKNKKNKTHLDNNNIKNNIIYINSDDSIILK